MKIFEATNTVQTIAFAPNAPELLTRLPDPLGDTSRDFSFVATSTDASPIRTLTNLTDVTSANAAEETTNFAVQ